MVDLVKIRKKAKKVASDRKTVDGSQLTVDGSRLTVAGGGSSEIEHGLADAVTRTELPVTEAAKTVAGTHLTVPEGTLGEGSSTKTVSSAPLPAAEMTLSEHEGISSTEPTIAGASSSSPDSPTATGNQPPSTVSKLERFKAGVGEHV